jgi:D-alanyl-D-alanine carboxypeptidase
MRKLVAVFFFFQLMSCTKQNSVKAQNTSEIPSSREVSASLIEEHFSVQLSQALENANLPESITQKIQQTISTNPAFIMDLFVCLQDDVYLRILVDKQHPLKSNYAPSDLINLRNASYRVSRSDLQLRSPAAAALEEMAQGAKAEGLSLLASSAYRSYDYQVQLFDRYAREMGREEADKISARAGFSQHQLGLVIDFGSIDDSFALTKEGKWLTANASRFGWSLSYPRGYEAITGYNWESWHYRYVGRDLAEFIDNYFEGIQQYALKFIWEWEQLATNN